MVIFLASDSPSKHISDLQELIDAGAELDAESEYGNTPLHLVAWNDQAPERRVNRTLKILMDAGTDVNIRNDSGQTPLHISTCAKAVAMYQCLIKPASSDECRSSLAGATKKRTPAISAVRIRERAAPAHPRCSTIVKFD